MAWSEFTVKHVSLDPSYLGSTVQVDGGGVMVWGTLSWHTLYELNIISMPRLPQYFC